MHVHFYVAQLTLGGIETYVTRVAEALHKAGHRISVTVVKDELDNGLLARLQAVAEVNVLEKFSRVSLIILSPPPIAPTVDLVFATGRTSFFFASQAASRTLRPLRLVCGVFWQNEFLPNNASELFRRSSMALLRQLGPNNIVFCTEGCRDQHAAATENSWGHAKVSPLLVNLPPAAKGARLRRTPADRLRIISVGRYVRFKSYNLYMPGVVRELLDRGVAVEWAVFGAGAAQDEMRKRVIESAVQDAVTINGSVTYANYPELLAQADLYIGAGTTLIEASAAGIPAIIALDDSTAPETPGFFFENKGYYTSDASDSGRLVSVADLIENFSRLALDERTRLRSLSRAASERYSIANAEREFQRIRQDAREAVIPYPQINWGNEGIREILKRLRAAQ